MSRTQSFAYSSPGGRDHNEDYYLCREGIWIVADGLGGHNSGEVASRLTAEQTALLWEKSGRSMDSETLSALIGKVNQAVLEEQQSSAEVAGMRSTLVFAVSDGTKVRWANVGDSRLYYFRDGAVLWQTEDHSVPALAARMGEIRQEDIRFHEDRNKLLKVIGDRSNLNPGILPESIEMMQGDAMLLCTDGFWEYVYEEEMLLDLSKSENPAQWLSYMAKRLLLRTEQNGNDNFTAVCIQVLPDDVPD